MFLLVKLIEKLHKTIDKDKYYVLVHLKSLRYKPHYKTPGDLRTEHDAGE